MVHRSLRLLERQKNVVALARGRVHKAKAIGVKVKNTLERGTRIPTAPGGLGRCLLGFLGLLLENDESLSVFLHKARLYHVAQNALHGRLLTRVHSSKAQNLFDSEGPSCLFKQATQRFDLNAHQFS
jgi:hypothetical protein